MLEEVDDTLDSSELKEIVHTEWDLFLGKLTQLLSKVFYPYEELLVELWNLQSCC